jgi:excinuclease ABC subunit C
MNMEDIKNLNIPKSPGSYQFKDSRDHIIYIGKASNLYSRVLSYFRESANHTPAKFSMVKKIEKIEWIETDSEIEALLLESNLVKKYQPIFNVDLKDDKRFLYIKISTEDEIPGVFATRKIDKSGKYFGPFTSAQAVRETMKAIRKIWPYCTERKVGKKICFYAQIGRCTGVCGGKLGLKEYKDVIIKPINLFLDGKKKEIIKNEELRIKNLEKEIVKL